MFLQVQGYAVKLNINEFKASNGWLYRLCQRHNTRQMKFQGERRSVDNDGVDAFKACLPSLVEGYEEKDIYDMDESE